MEWAGARVALAGAGSAASAEAGVERVPLPLQQAVASRLNKRPCVHFLVSCMVLPYRASDRFCRRSAHVTGQLFPCGCSEENIRRLGFATADVGKIEEGVARLGQACEPVGGPVLDFAS